jgi:hypothetical protein
MTLFVMARLVRATYRGTVLEQVARTSRAMTVWQRPRRLSSQPEQALQRPFRLTVVLAMTLFVMARLVV